MSLSYVHHALIPGPRRFRLIGAKKKGPGFLFRENPAPLAWDSNRNLAAPGEGGVLILGGERHGVAGLGRFL